MTKKKGRPATIKPTKAPIATVKEEAPEEVSADRVEEASEEAEDVTQVDIPAPVEPESFTPSPKHITAFNNLMQYKSNVIRAITILMQEDSWNRDDSIRINALVKSAMGVDSRIANADWYVKVALFLYFFNEHTITDKELFIDCLNGGVEDNQAKFLSVKDQYRQWLIVAILKFGGYNINHRFNVIIDNRRPKNDSNSTPPKKIIK